MGQTQVLEVLKSNPLHNKDDFSKSLLDMFEPLVPHFSEGAAQVKLFGAASFDDGSSYLEGFSRPLWGLVPFAMGGGACKDKRADEIEKIWALYRKGLENGSNPNHPEYWGDPSVSYNQRCVEMAAIGFALAAAPEVLWEPLSAEGKNNLATWLATIQHAPVAQNNWLFFVILSQEGLINVGREDLVDQSVYQAYLERLDSYYFGEGWYRDGENGGIDHYNGFALHFYGLLYAYLHEERAKKGLPHIFESTAQQYTKKFRNYSELFAKTFIYWFSDQGDALPIGRSLTYRFACGAFWGILAHFGHPDFSLGVIKGVWARHLRYWKDKPIFELNNTLSRGFLYSSNFLCERYNSPTSPYWAFKYFAPLMLADNHPFWNIAEEPLPKLNKVMAVHGADMIVRHNGSYLDVESALSVQKHMRHTDRYNKFGYSSRNGFNVESDSGWSFGDSVMLFSDDKIYWKMRTGNVIAPKIIDDHILYYQWNAGKGISAKTYAIVRDDWTIRYHQVDLEHDCYIVETGYAVSEIDQSQDSFFFISDIKTEREAHDQSTVSVVGVSNDFSFIGDLEAQRVAVHNNLYPNTNVLYMRTQGVALSGFYKAGQIHLVTAVCNNLAYQGKEGQLLEAIKKDFNSYKDKLNFND